MKSRVPLVLGLCVMLAGCGYALAGEWRDDPKNWERAFGVALPGGLIVHHSYYARFPHFTNEWCYYFEIEDSKAARDAIGVYAFLKLSNRRPPEVSLDAGRPSWFLKEVPADGSVYEYPGATAFFVIIDQARGRIFVHDQQF